MAESYILRDSGWQSLTDGHNVNVVSVSDVSTGFLPGWGMPTWRDEFTGTTINTATWNVRDGYAESQDQSIMRAANVTVSNSCLYLTAKRETSSNGTVTRSYTSGYVDTIGKWSRRYGRFEVRAKLPTDAGVSRGLWPGIWLRDSTEGGEVDILETIGTPNNQPGTYPTGAGYWSSSLYRTTGVKGTSPYWTRVFQNNTSDGQFHVWSYEWQPNQIMLYCDGVKLHTISGAEWDAFKPGFTSAVNWRIDLFIGSSWQGWADDTGVETVLPRSLVIDYIRHWDLPA